MFGLVRPSVRALGLTTTLAVVAGAQATKECEVNESRPASLGRASLAVMTAAQAQTPDAAKRQLNNAMRQLNGIDDKSDNQAGRGFVFGKALVVWAMQPGVGLDTKRGVVGLSGSPDAPLDIAVTVDSAFKVVESAMPECAVETAKWRGQKPWIELINKAIETLNEDKTDSAALIAEKAITLNPFAPYGFVVLANVKQRQQKSSEAMALYRKSVDLAAKDTTFDDIRRQSLAYLGSLAADSAEVAPDEASRKPYIDQARAAFDEILADPGAAESQAMARNGLCRIAIASGDTVSLRQTYKDQLANPTGFEYGDLMNAGVCMARADMVPEAVSLFQGAYAKNGYHRDVLANLTILLLRQEEHDKALPHAIRLASVEPNNSENLQLLVLAYAGIAQRTRNVRVPRTTPATPATTKTGAKAAPGSKTTGTKAPAPAQPRLSAAVSDSLFKVEQAYTDSAIKANIQKDSLQVRVSLSEFTMGKDKTTLSGSINLAQGAKAGEYALKVDFLDARGSVVAAQEAKVPVTADRAGRFKVEAAGGNVAGFRYVVVAP